MTPEAIAETYRRDVDPNADVTTLTTLIRQAQGMALRDFAAVITNYVELMVLLGINPGLASAIAGVAVEKAARIEEGV